MVTMATTKKGAAVKPRSTKATSVVVPVFTATEAKSLMATAAKENSAAEKHVKAARIASARATYAAFSAGLVQDGRGKRAATVEFSGAEFAAHIGVKPGTVTGLRTLGYALARFGVESLTESPEYGDLSSTVKSAAVRKAIESPKATAATVLAAAKRTKAAGNKSTGTGNGNGTSAEQAPAMPRNNSGRLDLAETALAALKNVSAAERKRIAGTLLDLVLTHGGPDVMSALAPRFSTVSAQGEVA